MTTPTPTHKAADVGRAFLSVLRDPAIAWRSTGAKPFIDRVAEQAAIDAAAPPAEAPAERGDRDEDLAVIEKLSRVLAEVAVVIGAHLPDGQVVDYKRIPELVRERLAAAPAAPATDWWRDEEGDDARGKACEFGSDCYVVPVRVAQAAIEKLSAPRVTGGREDSARLDFIERTFSGMTNRERYLPVQMIWGKGANGRTLREACDKYMNREAATQEPQP